MCGVQFTDSVSIRESKATFLGLRRDNHRSLGRQGLQPQRTAIGTHFEAQVALHHGRPHGGGDHQRLQGLGRGSASQTARRIRVHDP